MKVLLVKPYFQNVEIVAKSDFTFSEESRKCAVLIFLKLTDFASKLLKQLSNYLKDPDALTHPLDL